MSAVVEAAAWVGRKYRFGICGQLRTGLLPPRLKAPRTVVDDLNVMEFWVIIGAIALVFGWVAGLAEISGTPEDGFATGTKTAWLLLVILTGVVGLVAYVLVGKKRRPLVNAGASSSNDVAVWASSRTDNLTEPGPNTPISPVASTNAFGFDPSTSSAPALIARSSEVPPPATVELKTCPDCAEEVRSAARKCRFCGCVFESQPIA